MGQKGLKVQVVRTSPRSPSLPPAVDRNGFATESFKQNPLESRCSHRMRQVRLQFSPALIPRPYRVLILVPVTRAILRFAILRITRRPLVGPPVPERDFDIASLPPSSNSSSPTLAPSSPSLSPPQTPDHLKNNHVPLQPHYLLAPPPPPATAVSPIDDFLLPKALSTSSVKAPSALIKPLSSPRDWLVESLYILRPLIYGKVFLDGVRVNYAHHSRSYHVVS